MSAATAAAWRRGRRTS